MEKLYVLYDPKCELCERLKDWLLIQHSWLGLMSSLEVWTRCSNRPVQQMETLSDSEWGQLHVTTACSRSIGISCQIPTIRLSRKISIG